MSTENKELVRKIRGQIARRYVDSSMLNVHCVGGSVHLSGVLRIIRTHANVNLKEEMETISTILRTVPGVRDVVWDVTLRT
jgi:hypothetical protein